MELAAGASATAQDKARRGEYLVTIMDCAGCHTPGALTGKPDTARAASAARRSNSSSPGWASSTHRT